VTDEEFKRVTEKAEADFKFEQGILEMDRKIKEDQAQDKRLD
jgi:hypothetical protein